MLKEVNIYVKNTCEFVFRLMLFLAVFDGIRSRTPIADQVTIFKEVCTFSLFAIILFSYTSGIHKRALYYSNVVLLVYLLVMGTLVISINDVSRNMLPSLNRKELTTPFAMHFKNIESIIVVFVLLHYQHLTGRSISRLMDFFVHLCVGYILFTLVIYFQFDSSTFFQTPWYGRISIGYPTSDAQILCFGLAFVVFGKSYLPLYIKGIYIVILLIGVFMNATATGILSAVFILLSYMAYYFFSGKMVAVFSTRSLLYISLVVVVFFIGRQLADSVSDKMGTYSSLLETKLGFLTSKINKSLGDDNTVTTDYDVDFSEEVRKVQVEKAFTFNKDIASMTLGGPISLGTFIENENYFLIRSYGYIGLLLYYAWLVMLGLAAFRRIKKQYAQLLLIAIAILIVTNSAIITTYLFGIAVSFGLFVSYYYNKSAEEDEAVYYNIAQVS